MICPNCNTRNEIENDFCVSCGRPLNATAERAAGVGAGLFQAGAISTKTRVVGHTSQPSPGKYSSPWALIGGMVAGILVLAIGGVIVAVYLLMPGEVLPDHLGMFVQSDAKDRVDEIRKQDITNVLEGKATLLKDDSLPSVPSAPNLIFYADGKEADVSELRLIQLDTIKDDGSMKQIDFQKQQVGGKPEMKRLRIPDGLANGKYALAFLDGYMNEGKHKFWAFQVKDSSKSDNGSALMATTFPVKPKPTPPPAPMNAPRATVPPPVQVPVAPPAGASVAYTRTNNVLIRAAPSLYGQVRGKIGVGQPVYVYGYSGYDCFKGQCGSWAQIQTASGTSGYILSVLLR